MFKYPRYYSLRTTGCCDEINSRRTTGCCEGSGLVDIERYLNPYVTSKLHCSHWVRNL